MEEGEQYKEKYEALEQRRLARRVELYAAMRRNSSVPTCIDAVEIDATGARDFPLDRSNGLPQPVQGKLYWLRVTGFKDVDTLREMAEGYGISPDFLCSLLSPVWRSQVEQAGDFLFFLLQFPPSSGHTRSDEHLAFFCKPGLVLTFEEEPLKVLDVIREQVGEEGWGTQCDNLAAAMAADVMQCIMAAFFSQIDEKDARLARLEEKIAEYPTPQVLRSLYHVKKDLITLNRLLTPFEDLGGKAYDLLSESGGITPDLRRMLLDFKEQIHCAAAQLRTFADVSRSLDEIYQSILSNSMNEIIKILTIISTIFLPLSLIAGIYGMNFDSRKPMNMPELSMAYAYPVTLLAMASIAVAMLLFFRRKGWIAFRSRGITPKISGKTSSEESDA